MKDPNSFYMINGSRIYWLKLKNLIKVSGLSDTLDLVPIGAFFGRGRRSGFLGSYLIGSYNPDDDKVYAICNVGTGLKDVDLEELTKLFKHSLTKVKPDFIVE